MNLDKFLMSILLTITGVVCAGTKPDGYEKYNAYRQFIYIDNLETNIASRTVLSSYYSKLSSKEYCASQNIDTVNRKRELRIVTKKAQEGYLFINEVVSSQIMNNDYSPTLVTYFIDEKLVSTNKDIQHLVRLKKKDIDISRLSVRFENEIVKVYIYCKGVF